LGDIKTDDIFEQILTHFMLPVVQSSLL